MNGERKRSMEKAIAMRPAAAGRYGRYTTSKMMIKSFKCVSCKIIY